MIYSEEVLFVFIIVSCFQKANYKLIQSIFAVTNAQYFLHVYFSRAQPKTWLT